MSAVSLLSWPGTDIPADLMTGRGVGIDRYEARAGKLPELLARKCGGEDAPNQLRARLREQIRAAVVEQAEGQGPARDEENQRRSA